MWLGQKVQEPLLGFNGQSLEKMLNSLKKYVAYLLFQIPA